MPPVEMSTRGETPFDSIFVVNGCKIIRCARVKGGIVAKLLKSGTVSLRDICRRDKQGTISSHKNWLNKKETKSLSINYLPERSEIEKHVWNNKINSSHLLRMKTGDEKKGGGEYWKTEKDESMMLQPQLGKAVVSEVSGCLTRDLHIKSYSSKFLIKQSNQSWTQVLQRYNSYASLWICFPWTPNGSLLNTSSCWISGWYRLSWSFPRSFFSPTGLGIKKGKETLSGYAPGIHSSVRGDKVSEREKQNIFQWPWHLILMQKRKGITVFEAKSMKFLYISYDLISPPPPTYGRFLYRSYWRWANSAPAMSLMIQWKVSNHSIICSISHLFYPQSPKTCLFWWNKCFFPILWIELKIYLITKWIKRDRVQLFRFILNLL